MGSNVGGAIDVELQGQQVNLCGPGNALTALGLVVPEFLPSMLTFSVGQVSAMAIYRISQLYPIFLDHSHTNYCFSFSMRGSLIFNAGY